MAEQVVPARNLTLRTRDGLALAGVLVAPQGTSDRAVALVHGAAATRDEGGFFTRLAKGLAAAGVASLRFDLRAHGESQGRQEEFTLCGVLTDIAAALDALRVETAARRVSVVGASFSGGLCGYYAAEQQAGLASLVMLNPVLNYRKRVLDDMAYWREGRLEESAARELLSRGYLEHAAMRVGRALLNEVVYLRPERALSRIITPTLIVHGTGDTVVAVESSRRASTQIAGETKLIEIDGADHGFTVPDDPKHSDPQTQSWQAFVIEAVADWITRH